MPVRLWGGNNPKLGRVQVFWRGIWGHVATLSANGANVVCREIFGEGTRGVVTSQPFFAQNWGNWGLVWRDGDNCGAQDDSFLSCSREPYSWYYWSSPNPIYQVACYSRTGEVALSCTRQPAKHACMDGNQLWYCQHACMHDSHKTALLGRQGSNKADRQAGRQHAQPFYQASGA